MPLFKSPEPDPSLEAFDHGAGILRTDGIPVGHVFTLRGWFLAFPRKRWWIWYLVVWADGSREYPAEDYPPFLAVNEMKSGYLELIGTKHDGRYDFEWLSPEDAVSARDRYSITDRDF